MTASRVLFLTCVVRAVFSASTTNDHCDGAESCAATGGVVVRNPLFFDVDVYAELPLLPGRSMAPWDFRSRVEAGGEAFVGTAARWIATQVGTDLPIFEGVGTGALVIEEQPRLTVLNKRQSGSVKMWNDHGVAVDLHKGKPSDKTFVTTLPASYRRELNVGVGDSFFVTAAGKPKRVLAGPITWNGSATDLFVIPAKKSLSAESWPAQTRRAIDYTSEYRTATGRTYLGHFGNAARPPPQMFMHKADHVGQRIAIPGKRNLELEAVSLSPRVFLARNFLSSSECDKIIAAAAKQMEGTSTIGPQKNVRSGERAWLSRKSHGFMDQLYNRAARLMNTTLREDNVEQLQVVHYGQSQSYFSHFDCDFQKLNTRAATLLLYLTDQKAGGETNFPRAFGSRGLKLHPGMGSAVLFYSVLEDGNIDELAQHAALPVTQGEKWLCNLWLWDQRTDFSID